MLNKVRKAQWDRGLRVQSRSSSSSSFAVGRGMLALDQSTLRPCRGCAGRKFSIMGVEFFPSKCSAENWDSWGRLSSTGFSNIVQMTPS